MALGGKFGFNGSGAGDGVPGVPQSESLQSEISVLHPVLIEIAIAKANTFSEHLIGHHPPVKPKLIPYDV